MCRVAISSILRHHSFPPHIRCQVTLPRAPGPDVRCLSVSSAVSQSQPGSDGINKSASDNRSDKEHVINAMTMSSCQKQSYPQCCHCLPNPARAKPWSLVSLPGLMCPLTSLARPTLVHLNFVFGYKMESET